MRAAAATAAAAAIAAASATAAVVLAAHFIMDNSNRIIDPTNHSQSTANTTRISGIIHV